MRRRGAVVAVVLVAIVAVALAVVAAVGPTPEEESATPAADRLVAPDGTDSYVWPYTSRTRSVAGRTLALNVVVHGAPERVHRTLVDRTETNWSAVDDNETVAVSPWRPAHGSTRYTYVAVDRNATGRWVGADYQLDVGSYFGRRVHVRAYAGPSDNTTALQAHTEYWDWFRVRHTVTGVETGAAFVERDLRDEPFVSDVFRTDHGVGGGGGSSGWWTNIHLVTALVVGSAVVPHVGRRPRRSDVLLPVALVGLVLGVRAWGLAGAEVFAGVDPKLFVVIGYPVLAAGPPAIVAATARDGPATRVAVLAAAGLTAGLTLDLAVVGVHQLPARLALHRLALVCSIGLVAFGSARRDRVVLTAGAVAWGGTLAASLFGVF